MVFASLLFSLSSSLLTYTNYFFFLFFFKSVLCLWSLPLLLLLLDSRRSSKMAAPMARGSLVCSHHRFLDTLSNSNHRTFLSLHPPRPRHLNHPARSTPYTAVFLQYFEPMGHRPMPTPRRRRLDFSSRAADSPSSVSSSSDKILVPDDEFSLAKVFQPKKKKVPLKNFLKFVSLYIYIYIYLCRFRLV